MTPPEPPLADRLSDPEAIAADRDGRAAIAWAALTVVLGLPILTAPLAMGTALAGLRAAMRSARHHPGGSSPVEIAGVVCASALLLGGAVLACMISATIAGLIQ